MKVLLFSGGIDSTCLAWSERPDRLAFIDYGQIPAKGELRACESIADELKTPFDVLTADLRQFGSGSMAGKASAGGSAVTEFWPYRNQMLITLVAMAYHGQNLREIIIGTVNSDQQHPDGRPAFLSAMNGVLGSQSDVTVRAPAAKQETGQLIEVSNVPASLLGWTFSCHTGEWACGQCGGCRKNSEVKRGFGF
ncbi:MAG: 7-cyano-7-deazaguanine synthase [Rhodobacteraceae bacterium]|nr:7-cyano-7-deazaguanine synthase [Paracoccaceae bacterium]